MNDKLFEQIVDVHSRVTGWCPVDKALVLASLVVALRPKCIVEIGVWGGRSLLPMAMAAEAINCGTTVAAIDPWDPKASTEGYEGKNAEWWSTRDHNAVYESFVTHVMQLGLAGRVTIFRARSDDLEPPPEIDLLHIDGQHSDQAIRDAERFGSRVVPGGFCVTDDDDWSGGGPKAALSKLEQLGFVRICGLGTGSLFRRR